jgi:leucyl-tRNA synthetase
VTSPEPFARLVNQGYVLADAFTDERGQYVPAAEVTTAADGSSSYHGRPVTRRAGKMGKSLKNGVAPDQIYRDYGADTLRLQEMAAGPIRVDRPWQPDDITGMHRMLQRLWRSIVSEQTGEPAIREEPPDADALRLLHRTIAVAAQELEDLRFHTAIARIGELVTAAARMAARDGGLPRGVAEPVVLMLAPLTPHICEELWSRLGHEDSLAYEPFPTADPALARDPDVCMPVQVDGRTRLVLEVPAGAGQAEIEQLLTEAEVTRLTGGRTIRRMVIVPGRIVNIVTR